jgi:hypothetical protein
MANISVDNAVVELSETTVRSLMRAIDKAIENYVYDPEIKKPEGDCSVETWNRYEKNNGVIYVESPYSKIRFKIQMETKPNSQESIGYSLKK